MKIFIAFILFMLALLCLIDNRKVYSKLKNSLSYSSRSTLWWWNVVFVGEILIFVFFMYFVLTQ